MITKQKDLNVPKFNFQQFLLTLNNFVIEY